MDLNTINETEFNKTTIATIDNTTIAIRNFTDEERNNTLASPPKVFQIHIQFEQHQIQEMEPKEETTSKSIQYFPYITLFLLCILLV